MKLNSSSAKLLRYCVDVGFENIVAWAFIISIKHMLQLLILVESQLVIAVILIALFLVQYVSPL